jgi:hypothetical protein
MKYVIIIIIILVLLFLVKNENFDVSGNLNLLTNSEPRFDKATKIPISADVVDDSEIPKQVEFDQKLNITTLQKLKAVNNILERIRDASISDNKSLGVTVFNPALLPVQSFEPDFDKLNILNNHLINKLKYYSGSQYELSVYNMDNAYGAETDDQYRIAYFIYGTIDKIRLKIIVDLIIVKSVIGADLNIIFSELRIDNPNVFITPYNDVETSKYELITDYNKTMKGNL